MNNIPPGRGNGKPQPPGGRNGDRRFCRYYRHYRTGRLMDAHRYGYKGWPFGRGR